MRPLPSRLAAVLLLVSAPALAERADSIPPPPPGSFVVDTTGSLKPATVSELNAIARQLDASGQGQLGVLVVRTTSGQDARAFATAVFNRWRIGHADRDDGVMLFAALGDRAAEIVLGDGVDADADVSYSDQVMGGRIVPAFRAGDPDRAMLEGARGLVALLAQTAINGGGAQPQGVVSAPTAERFKVSLPRSTWVADVDGQVVRDLQQRLNELSWAQQADGLPPFAFVFYDPGLHGGAAPEVVSAWAREDLPLRGDEWVIALAPRTSQAFISTRRAPRDAEQLADLDAASGELGALAGALYLEVSDVRAQDRFFAAAEKLREFSRTGTYPRSVNERVSAAVSTHGKPIFGGVAGAFVVGLVGVMRWARRRPRTCQHCQTPRQLLDEAYDDVHLTVGQKKEEQLKSVDYDVWWCGRCRDALVLRYGTFFTGYSRCGSCSHVTQRHSTRTLVSATYDHGGVVEVNEHCEHCGYHRTYQRHTARLTRSSSSSSSSSRSSFGGGSSSGRGSSGRW